MTQINLLVRFTSIMLALVTYTATQVAIASESNHNLHVHGLAELVIAIEENKLEIQLTSPAMNLVGFEHKATSKEQLTKIENTKSKLNAHDTLFSIQEGKCQHIRTSIDVSSLIQANHHKHHHEHHHDSHKSKNERHSEITANYQYHCNNSSELSSITTSIFHSFSGVHEINAMWATPAHQGANILTANNRTIEFR